MDFGDGMTTDLNVTIGESKKIITELETAFPPSVAKELRTSPSEKPN
jgi:hypothetical protein